MENWKVMCTEQKIYIAYTTTTLQHTKCYKYNTCTAQMQVRGHVGMATLETECIMEEMRACNNNDML